MTTKVNSSVLSPTLSGFTSITSSTFASTATTGTAPFTVTSTTPVTNLNIGGNAQTSTTASNLNGSWTQLPAGTVTNFFQAAAPTGWTQNNTYTNHMMRIVSGTGGGSFAGDSPIVNGKTMATHTHTFAGAAHSHDITDPGHTHVINVNSYNNSTSTGGGGQPCTYGLAGSINSAVTGISINNATATGTNSTVAGVSWTPSYIDNILCSKN